jgi:hypothetical protein
VADETTFPDIIRGAVLASPNLDQFFDGYVPEKVAETEGYIDPYVVLWAGLGDNPFEPTACGTHNQDTVIWDFQTTVVAADPDTCRRAAKEVKARLMNLAVGTGRVKPNPDGFNQQAPILDTQTTPSRFMLPVQWRITTN